MNQRILCGASSGVTLRTFFLNYTTIAYKFEKCLWIKDIFSTIKIQKIEFCLLIKI